MPLAPGTTIGPYKLTRSLGAGGMGVVWAADDVRLGRTVALKFLPPAVSTDLLALERFRREAQTASALNHPNICTIHDIGSTPEGEQFIVMELLEGQTLRGRLEAGPVSVDQVLEWAAEIARGLQAAHAKAIVHRDLKPENLFITADGRVKILDFGLAKLTEPSLDIFSSNTPTALHTATGIVLGTVGYMAPEQVRGEAADHRADIFAFGAIVYELLAGRRAFAAPTATETMHAILHAEPAEPSDAGSHPGLMRTVRRCLQKQPDRRFQSTSDLTFAIESLAARDSGAWHVASPPGGASHRRRNTTAWMVGSAALAALGGYAFGQLRSTSEVRPAVVLSALPPEGSAFGTSVLSPDGKWLAFSESGTSRSHLWIRPLHSAVAQRLSATEGATNPFWSPDSKALGFFADRQLKVIDIAGGPPRVLCSVQQNRGGSWSREGEIIFAPDLGGTLMRVPASNGPPSMLTSLDLTRGEATHRWPYFLPDGRHFLYFVRTTRPEHDGVYVSSLDGATPRRLFAASTNAVYAPPGFVLFVRNGTLLAQDFDSTSLTLSGAPRPLVERVGYALQLNRAGVSVSETGMLAYGDAETTQLVWFDKANQRKEPALAGDHYYAQLWLSPDGSRVAFDRPDASGANDIYVSDVDRPQIAWKLTVDPASDVRPVWVGNDRVVWSSLRKESYNLYMQGVAGNSREELLVASTDRKYPSSVSSDSRWLLFDAESSGSSSDVWILPLESPRQPCRVLGSEFAERQARISPKGRWVAYTTDRDGSAEVYVTDINAALAMAATRPTSRSCLASTGTRVSASGGTQPMWRSDGTALFYLVPDGQLMSVPISPTDATLRPGLASTVLRTASPERGSSTQTYAPSPDGETFLVITPTRPTNAATVVLNWTALMVR